MAGHPSRDREESGVVGLRVANQDDKDRKCVGVIFCDLITFQSCSGSIEIPRLGRTLFAQQRIATDMRLNRVFAAYSKAEVLNQERGVPSLSHPLLGTFSNV